MEDIVKFCPYCDRKRPEELKEFPESLKELLEKVPANVEIEAYHCRHCHKDFLTYECK